MLERACFQAIMMKTGLERIEERKAFLRRLVHYLYTCVFLREKTVNLYKHQ